MTMRVGVLASGSGSNFSALVDALNVSGSPARVEVLLCNVPGARAVQRAQAAGVAVELVDHRPFGKDRAAYDAAIVEALRKHQVELVCLAGFMRLVGETLLSAFPSRVLNIHPALLPSFPGMHAPRQAVEYGVKVSGVTVHFVDEGTDTGPVIAQTAVPVMEGDDEAALAARILVEEHRLYPQVVRAIAEGRVKATGRKVSVTAR
ncbi:MAG: phosphoribosylglycinamide formyltransferase [Myxococcaceae bacterium]|nr:phosphoribosylglycinamide formyltransferase [Myxococcaceae bacterium]